MVHAGAPVVLAVVPPDGAVLEAADVPPDGAVLEAASEAPAEDVRPATIHIWAVCSDAGSDEAKARRLHHACLMSNVHQWLFDSDCFCHQYQLLAKTVLGRMDRVLKKLGCEQTYWATLAKIMNCWREKRVQST